MRFRTVGHTSSSAWALPEPAPCPLGSLCFHQPLASFLSAAENVFLEILAATPPLPKENVSGTHYALSQRGLADKWLKKFYK